MKIDMTANDEWKGFRAGNWCYEINVEDFIIGRDLLNKVFNVFIASGLYTKPTLHDCLGVLVLYAIIDFKFCHIINTEIFLLAKIRIILQKRVRNTQNLVELELH